ncbi:MAG: penicillin-binding protein [Actinomycetota bacterium]|nr:penicillin-binding protein [Actinomycetota bacterium]
MRSLPWARILLATLGIVVLIAVVPPFRRAAAMAGSRLILFVASPLAPGVTGFDDLEKASRVTGVGGAEVGFLGTEQREPVPLTQVPPHVTRAVLAAEDNRFYDHSGVDPAAVFGALRDNLLRKDSRGGSTITQQLAKLNYTGSQRTYLRKLREVLYAAELEDRYSKDELLERYLNQVYFGEGAYGIGLASAAFFGVPPQELTPAQGALLAGKIRAPNTLDPYKDPGGVKARRDQVLRNMERHGWLSGAELASALAAPVEVVPRAPGVRGVAANSRAPHFLAFVAREAGGIDALGSTPEARTRQILTGGYTVESTLDVEDLDAAVNAAKQQLGQPGDPTTAVVSVQPGDGAIRVLFGGLDPGLEFDPASQGRRQPGSSFKPYLYLAMLKAGMDPRTTYDSGSPQTLNCRGSAWTVRNFEGEGGGPSNVDNAMVHSINTVFAQIMVKVGPQAMQDVAEKTGIAPEAVTPPECAMALGGLRQGVSPLEQAAGFATFAARGMYAEPYAITRIKDRDGKVVYEHRVKTSRAVSEKEAGVLTGALRGVVEEGTGTAARFGRPLAGKTGTTDNYGNAWFIGYVPQLATAVWVGRPEGDVPMRNVRGINVTGGSFPARIFSRYMGAAMAGEPVQELYVASPDELSLKSPPPTGAPPTAVTNTSVTTTTTSPPSDGSEFPPNPTVTRPPATRPPITVSPVRPPTTTTTRPSVTTTTTARAGPQDQR